MVEKKLIRSTLRNIELQLMDQSDFIRCHRTSIVNIIHINKLVRNYSGYSLKMSKLEEAINKEFNNRFMRILSYAKFTEEQVEYLQELADEHEPLGSPNHFAVNNQITRQKIMIVLSDDSMSNEEKHLCRFLSKR